MEVLGHAQLRTTTDTYSHVLPALGRDAADRMGDAVGTAGTVMAPVATTLAPKTTQAVPPKGNGLVIGVARRSCCGRG